MTLFAENAILNCVISTIHARCPHDSGADPTETVLSVLSAESAVSNLSVVFTFFERKSS